MKDRPKERNCMIKYFIENNMCHAEGKWPKTKKEALRESIRKWEFLVKHSSISCGGRNSCACCMLSDSISGKLDCLRCLIADAGHRECSETPYEDYDDNPKKKFAVAEVKFLKSLLRKQICQAKRKSTKR